MCTQFNLAALGRPASEVIGAEVLKILTLILNMKAPMARRVRQRIRAVMEWAVAMDLRPDKPVRPERPGARRGGGGRAGTPGPPLAGRGRSGPPGSRLYERKERRNYGIIVPEAA